MGNTAKAKRCMTNQSTKHAEYRKSPTMQQTRSFAMCLSSRQTITSKFLLSQNLRITQNDFDNG